MIDQKEGETDFAIKMHYDDMVSKSPVNYFRNHIDRFQYKNYIILVIIFNYRFAEKSHD